MTDTSDLCGRINAPLASVLSNDVERIVQYLTGICESPIEIMLGASVLLADSRRRVHPNCPALQLARSDKIELYDVTWDRLLVPQFKWDSYRIDWLYRAPPISIFVECDGRDFHERTKYQAARDRQKDRRIQQAGYIVLRFTGSEIFKAPLDCAQQILDCAEEQMGRQSA